MVDWSGDRTRVALQRFIDARKLKVQPWADRAGVSGNTIRNFLKGLTHSLTQKSLDKLALAEDVPVAALTDPDYPLEGAPAPELTASLGDAAELVRDCIIAVEELLEERNDHRSVEERADLVARLFDQEIRAKEKGARPVSGAAILRLVRRA